MFKNRKRFESHLVGPSHTLEFHAKRSHEKIAKKHRIEHLSDAYELFIENAVS